jgi:hypothetical protein
MSSLVVGSPLLAAVYLQGVGARGCGKETFPNGVKIGKFNGRNFKKTCGQGGYDILKTLLPFVLCDLVSLEGKGRRTNFEFFVGIDFRCRNGSKISGA